MNTTRPATNRDDHDAALIRYLDHRAEMIDRLEVGDRAELALWLGTLDAATGFVVPTQNRIGDARMIARGNRDGYLRTLSRYEKESPESPYRKEAKQ